MTSQIDGFANLRLASRIHSDALEFFCYGEAGIIS